MAESRTGFSFNNPDTTNDYHAPKWGLLVSADDLRYDELFGNDLVAESNSQAITDEQLLDYARCAIAYMERELNIDILPRRVRYMDRIDANGNKISRVDIAEEDKKFLSNRDRHQRSEQYIREQGYPYHSIPARHEFRIKLRRRPVRDLLSAKFVDPYFGSSVVDLMPYRIVKPGLVGTCCFRPNAFSRNNIGFNTIWQAATIRGFRDMQSLFLIDYETGYENCQDVPTELREIIKKIATFTLYNIYGVGKVAGIASQSVSLNSVSQSFSTTQSATSSMFGAQMLSYQKYCKEWFQQNRGKYSRTTIGCLGS